MLHRKQLEEFAAFLAKHQALRRGGAAVQAARNRQRRGFSERMAQVEAQRFWQAEIAARSKRRASSLPK